MTTRPARPRSGRWLATEPIRLWWRGWPCSVRAIQPGPGGECRRSVAGQPRPRRVDELLGPLVGVELARLGVEVAGRDHEVGQGAVGAGGLLEQRGDRLAAGLLSPV